jgi:hypothetical protein
MRHWRRSETWLVAGASIPSTFNGVLRKVELTPKVGYVGGMSRMARCLLYSDQLAPFRSNAAMSARR